VNSSLHNMLDW